MSLLKRLEARLRRWAIPNVTVMIIVGQILLYLAPRMRAGQGGGFDPTAYWLLPGKVLDGEIWRLVTFIFCPPGTNSIFVIIFWLLMYRFGTGLEMHWGTARYNLYLIVGIAAVFVTHMALWLWGGDGGVMTAQVLMIGLTAGFFDPNTFLYGSLFLAFSRVYPDFVIHLFFVLPIRVRWLALIQWCACGYLFLRGDNPVRLLVLASILNYLLFFGREHYQDLKSGQRRRSFQARTKQVAKSLVHRCLVCGLDSDTSPRTSFRYCSKCDGQCCYCPEHIQDHQHVVADGEDASDPQMVDSSKA